MVVIVFFRCSFFEHFQFGISIRVLAGLCSLSIFFLLFFSIRHRVLTPIYHLFNSLLRRADAGADDGADRRANARADGGAHPGADDRADAGADGGADRSLS